MSFDFSGSIGHSRNFKQELNDSFPHFMLEFMGVAVDVCVCAGPKFLPAVWEMASFGSCFNCTSNPLSYDQTSDI